MMSTVQCRAMGSTKHSICSRTTLLPNQPYCRHHACCFDSAQSCQQQAVRNGTPQHRYCSSHKCKRTLACPNPVKKAGSRLCRYCIEHADKHKVDQQSFIQPKNDEIERLKQALAAHQAE
jgi:hypothetical protein